MKKFLLVMGAGLLLVWGIPLGAEELIAFTQSWEKVDGAWGYKVEIQNSKGQIILTKNVKDPTIPLELPPGPYQIKVSGLNIFGFPENGTDWTKFVVRKIETPVIQQLEPRHAQEGIPFTLRIRSTGTDEKTRWFLHRADNPEKAQEDQSLNFIEDEVCEVHFNGIPSGLYNLEAVGRTGMASTVTQALFVTEPDPQVDQLGPRQAEAKIPLTLELKGRHLNQVSTVELHPQTDGASPARAKIKNHDREDLLALDFPPLEPGLYSLVVTSLNGQKSVQEKAFRVLMEAPEIHQVQVEENTRQITVNGTHWTEDMKLVLVRLSNRWEIPVIGQTRDTLVATYPEKLDRGTYDLVAVNNQGKETLRKDAVLLRKTVSLAIQNLDQEEFQPIIVTIAASKKLDQVHWVLNGTDQAGQTVSVNADSAEWIADESAWLLRFPGVPQGLYHVNIQGGANENLRFPHEIRISDHTPMVSRLLPDQIDADQKVTMELWGQYLKASGKLELIALKDQQVYPISVQVNATQTRAEWVLSGLPAGRYHLKVTSPQGKTILLPEALFIRIPLPQVEKGQQAPWDSQKKLLKTVFSGKKLQYTSRAFLLAKGTRTEVQIEKCEPDNLLISYPSSLGFDKYDLILATADGRETALPGALDIKAPAPVKVGGVVYDAQKPLVLKMRVQGIRTGSTWQIFGTTGTGLPLAAAAVDMKNEGDQWTLTFPALPGGQYHISVTDPAGKKTVFPGSVDIGS